MVYVGAAVLLLYSLVPVVWMVGTSLQKETALRLRPLSLLPNAQTFTWGNYAFILTGHVPTDVGASIQAKYVLSGTFILPGILNSIVIGIAVTIINVVLGLPAAHVFSRYRFWGDRKVLLGLLATTLMPAIAIVVPMFILFRSVGLLDTKEGLVAVYAATTLPLTIWLLKAYFDNVPVEYEEAARMDGCGYLRSLIRVAAPLVRPGLVAVAVLAFMTAYGEFVFASVLTATLASRTETVVIANIAGALSASRGLIAASTVVCFVPPIVLAIVFRKQIMAGLTTGLHL